MPELSLAEALRLPAFRQAGPVVVAGGSGIDRPIRWLHVTELADIAPLLRPGDLVLTTGTGLPADPDGLGSFAASLADAQCAGLVIEQGRRWTELPAALTVACDDRGLPLVALTHETRFAALTQAVGEQIIDRQLADLRDAERVHETFTELSFAEAGPSEILDAVQRLADGPVVLESADHRPLDYLAGRAGGQDVPDFLANWQSRSARVRISGRTGWDERNGWLVTRLGSRERGWGRLVISSPARPTSRMVAVAERAAAALALHRLHDRDRDNLVRRTHHELITGLRTRPNADEVLRRCDVAGFPTQRRNFVGLRIRQRAIRRDSLDELLAATVAATHAARIPALVDEVDRDIVVLLSGAANANLDPVVDRLARRIARGREIVVASGRTAEDRDGIDRTLREAHQVADAVSARSGTPADAPEVFRLDDLHLRGLLVLLGDDDRVRLYVERELAALRDSPDLMAALRALLDHPGSKTDAASSLHLSRAAFYDRLAKIERLLALSLDDPDVRVSLHVALLAEEVAPPV